MKPKAVGHYILVRPKEYEKVSAGGIIIPEQARDQAGIDEGTVLEIGPDAYKGEKFESQWCEVGDKIAFPRYCGRHWPSVDEPEYYVMNDEDVLMVFDRED